MENNYIKESTIQNILSNKIDKISEGELTVLKSRIKEIEKKVKENNKPKTITISGKDHAKIKQFCTFHNLNIGDWVTKVLLKEIEDNNPIIIDNESTNEEILEKETKILKEKYFTELNKNLSLFKSNKILFSPLFKFQGYSITDSLPIYAIENTPDDEWLEENQIELKKVTKYEISSNIFQNIDLEVIF